MAAPLTVLVERWRGHPVTISGRLVVPAAARAFFLAGAAASAQAPVLAVVPGEREAEDLEDDLALFTERAFLLPAWETLPFEHVSPNITTMAQRAVARHQLAVGDPGTIVVASARAAAQRLSPSPVTPLVVDVGGEVPFDAFVSDLVDAGYHRTDRVEGKGEIAVRGGIVDVFAAQSDQPIRLEFWGDTVESARRFSPRSQRSTDLVERLVAYPARELRLDTETRTRAEELAREEPWAVSTWDRVAQGVLFAGVESWLPWLSTLGTAVDEHSGPLIRFDPVRIGDRIAEVVKEESELAAVLAPTWGTGAPDAGDHPPLYLEPNFPQSLEAPPLAAGPEDPTLRLAGLDVTPGDPDSVSAGISRLLQQGTTVVVAMDGDAAADRVQRSLAEAGLDLPRRDTLDSVESAVTAVGIHRGFALPDLKVAVLGEQEIAGRRRAHRRVRALKGGDGAGYRDLAEGDYVVHYRHGLGRFEGLVRRQLAGVEREYLVVAYAGEDRLYVPTDQLAAVQRYTGGEAPRLSRMGGSDWAATKTRVRQAAAVVAEQVVALHRRRAAATGHAFAPDGPWQRELELAFPFEETPDQLASIADVKEDMEADRPMDRLVFGDVGFGKTEVAIRVAFKAVTDGKQVAVLCPTTLLAQQHNQTFADRMASYPVRVEMLSRFLSTKEQKEVLAGLASGEVDVVIATHRLLSEDVRFRDLGLLVVDEEQRFGVSAKDRIKQFRVGVDVLTLTATPIPRTLEMALTGIRQVSHIRTAPVDRHPILTYVGPFDEQSVSAAIRRELLREGQVFYVHNRVQSIDRAVARLQILVPDAIYAVAHGQMSESQLEQVMLDFWDGRYDVLVATTIIESGLDLPQVNTLIVERADLLGLAQLYQLRGRVGRSHRRAYAYLFHPPSQALSEEAFHRLEAIGEYSDLGAGFDLARRDLEIRGAGSMLGEVQSGHIAAVGFDLYSRLVAEAVDELEGRDTVPASPAEVRIDLPVDAHIPDDYITNQAARLEGYRRLAAATTPGEVDDAASEWGDRFGPVPTEATALLEVARLRVEALRLGFDEVVQLRDEIRVGPVDLSASQEVRLERLAPGAVLRPAERRLFLPAPSPNAVVSSLLSFLREMWPDLS